MESSTINQTKILLNISKNYSNHKNLSLIMEEQINCHYEVIIFIKFKKLKIIFFLI